MEQKFCQSCGMPIDEQTFGKEADGTVNEDYCHYCYAEGKFTVDCTMEEMIVHCAKFVEEFNKDSETKLTKEEAIEQMRKFFPTLKRWKN
ncbi:MAG: transcriptional regulator [Bacteroidia bacterium]|nr:transcriptional regulator [Bacteroidia bacterium]